MIDEEEPPDPPGSVDLAAATAASATAEARAADARDGAAETHERAAVLHEALKQAHKTAAEDPRGGGRHGCR